MMENYDRTVELIDTAYSSAGKSSEQFAKYQDTVEYKLKQLTNTWEQLRTGFFSSDTYKDLIDFANKALNLVNDMDWKQILTVATIGLTLGKSIVSNFITGLKNSTGTLRNAWQASLQQVFNTNGKSLFDFQGLKNSIKTLTEKQLNESKYVINMNKVLGEKSLSAPNLEVSLEAQKTKELQNQLVLYNQLENKRQEILSVARSELATGRGLSAETLRQSNQAKQMTTEQLRYLNQLARELGYEQEITAENAQQLLQKMQEGQSRAQTTNIRAGLTSAGTSALSAGLTTALTMAISGADFETVLKTAGISAITAAIPSLISTFAPVIISFLTGPVGLITLATTAIVGGIALIVKKVNDANEAAEKAELDRLKSVKETNDELQKQQEQNLKNYKNKVTEKETLNANIERYQDLSSKAYLNTNEQEELSKIASDLNENYPDIIKTYDENTSEISFNTAALENLNTTLQEEIEQARIEANTNMAQQIGNYSDASNKTEELRKNFESFIEDTMSGWGYSKVSINSPLDARQYEKYGLNGYIVNEDSETGRAIVGDARKLLESIDQEFAIQAGITEDIYNLALDDSDVIDFIEELQKANISLGQFSSMTLQAAKNQEKAYDLEIIETERERVKNALQTMEDIDLSDEMTEILSYAAEDSAEAIKNQSEEAVNNYFKDISKAFSEKRGFDENKDFLRDIENWSFSTMAQNDEDIAKMKSALESLGYSEKENAEKDIKSIEDLFAGGTNLAKFDELSSQMQKALIALGYSSENWDANRKNSAKMKDILQKLMTYNMLAQDSILPEGLDEATLQQNISALNNFNQTINDYANKTLEEYSNEIEAAKEDINDENLKNSIDEYYAKSEDSILTQWRNAITSLEGIGLKGTDNLSYTTATYLNQMIQDLNLSESKRAQIIDVINKNTEGLSQTQKDVLFSIDLTQSYEDLLSNSEDYINQLVSTGMNATRAAELFSNYIKQSSLILSRGLFGEDAAKVFKDQLNEKISGFRENYQSIFDAQEEFIENGTLSSETYFKLLEDGFEDYVDITKDGYILLGDSAEEAWTKMAMQPKEELENRIEINKELLKQAKEVDTSFKPITWSDESVKNGSVLKKTYDDFDDLIAHYEKYGTHVRGITEEQKEYIEVISDLGYTTREEYIKALEEGTIALENMKPDVWIQGLINLEEAMESADNEVEDLKDELEDLNEELGDLNEQLIEDQEALADAEDELRQAIHGSDDFQSSLDGLVNYTEKIENLDKAIEKTKESLEDVSNIDEAKGLLSQLNEQYKDKTITIGAENLAIDAALSNLQSTLTQNYGDYISFDEEGDPIIDFAYMTMDANDEIRKAFEEEYNLYNEYKDKKEENLETLAKIEEEWKEKRKESLENFVAIQEDVISILKEKAQEEIDATKEKYDALEEADNNYLDALEEAIEKQRKLRDQQNQYEDLATKEKKLSLLQRDTSGANQKEVLSLQNEIEDDRQNLLDTEVDNLIESMKELYEQQKEARDAEIEYMEEVTENAQYFADWASNIMSTWQSVEDMQAWYLENDPDAQDMTVEQTEAYLNEIGEKYSDYVQYIAMMATDFTAEQENLNAAINEMFENTSNNVENIGTVTQEIARAAADELIEQATKARDDAADKLNETQQRIAETQQKIAETQQKLNEAENTALINHGAAMEAMVEASQSAMEEVSSYATKTLANMLGVDLTNAEQALKFANDYGFINQNGYVTQNFVNAVKSAGGDTSQYNVYRPGQDSYKVYVDPGNGAASQTIKIFSSKSEAESYVKEHNSEYTKSGGLKIGTNVNGSVKAGSFHYVEWGDGTRDYYNTKEQAENALNAEKKKKNSTKVVSGAKAYKTGGLVDYTGPAWVDGTRYKPEAFLNAEDTARIGEAAKILADIPILNSTSNSENIASSNIGDTSIEIHINIDNISSDYDVDKMIERVKQDIVDVSKPIGTSVILKK